MASWRSTPVTPGTGHHGHLARRRLDRVEEDERAFNDCLGEIAYELGRVVSEVPPAPKFQPALSSLPFLRATTVAAR
jgi:hypothetical protein